MTSFNNIGTLGCLVAITLLLFILKGRKYNRHKKNRKTSKTIIKKLKNFKGEHKNTARLNYLRKVDPYVYEEIILDGFSANNWKVVRNKRYSGDGGIDGKVVDKEGRIFYIQSKRYKGYINPKHVKDFKEKVYASKEAYGGFFIHTGETSAKLRKDTFESNVFLIGGKQMINHIIG